MSLKKQANKQEIQEFIRAIENGMIFYKILESNHNHELTIHTVDFISELIEWGRLNVEEFDQILIEYDANFVTIADIDKILFGNYQEDSSDQINLINKDKNVEFGYVN